MHRRFYGAKIVGIGKAREGLRRVLNRELTATLAQSDNYFTDWMLNSSAEQWWQGLDDTEKSRYEAEFQGTNGRPLNFGFPPDRVLLWKTVLRARQIKTSPDWIVEHTGIRERQFARDGVATSDLACEAIEEAMRVANITARAVDGIFLGTVSPDHPQTPPTTTVIDEKMGFSRGGVRNLVFRDISEACCSFMGAFDTAYAHLQNGRCETALVVGADRMTSTMSPFSRNLWPILADGAGALVLQRTHLDDDAFGPNAFFSFMNGRLKNLIVTPAGGSRLPVSVDMIRNPFDQRHLMLMDGPAVRKQAIRLLLPIDFEHGSRDTVMPVALAQAGFPINCRDDFTRALNEFDFVLFHQANGRMCEDLERKLKRSFGFRGACYSNIARYGNTTSASIPLLLYDLWQKSRLKPRGKQPKRILAVVFGGGFTIIVGAFSWTLAFKEENRVAA